MAGVRSPAQLCHEDTCPFRVVSAKDSSPSGVAVSSAIEKIEEALDFALVLTREGLEVLRIENAAGVVVRDQDARRLACANNHDGRRTIPCPGPGKQLTLCWCRVTLQAPDNVDRRSVSSGEAKQNGLLLPPPCFSSVIGSPNRNDQ